MTERTIRDFCLTKAKQTNLREMIKENLVKPEAERMPPLLEPYIILKEGVKDTTPPSVVRGRLGFHGFGEDNIDNWELMKPLKYKTVN